MSSLRAVVNASLQLLRDVLPTVVHLKTEIPESHLSARILGTERMGTGTIVDESGIVLTVNYVVLGAERVTMTLWDGREVAAEVVGQDFATGIAILSFAGSDFRAAAPRTSDRVEPGEEAFVVASVGGEGRRANSGAITSIEPFDAYWEYLLDRSLRVTIANPGFGGGPLFDRFGRVLGTVSLNLAEVGKLSLAIPTEAYVDAREDLLRHGRPRGRPCRPWVGIFCQVVSGHVVIAGLLPGGPGDRAGLRPGDVVLTVDDERVLDRPGLYRTLWRHSPGESAAFEVFRDNETTRLRVTGLDPEEIFG